MVYYIINISYCKNIKIKRSCPIIILDSPLFFLTLVHIKLSLDLNPTIVATLSYSKLKKIKAILSYFKKNVILAQKLAKYRLKKGKNVIDSVKKYKIKFA